MNPVGVLEKIPDIELLKKRFTTPQTGAVVVFEGKPRNDNGISALHYEVYDDMALRELRRIREEILNTFPVMEILIYHRRGKVEVGETSFVVIVFAKHRREAFEACSRAVDEVKKRVPIWKREVYPDGSLGEWILGI
jgi:molybdopterin synthase catalytic subunit